MAYIDSVDTSIITFIDEVNTNGAKSAAPIEIAKVESPLADRLKVLTGLDYSGYRVILTGDAVVHIEKRHGSSGAADHSMADPKDIARMGWVISNFDSVIKSGTTPAYSNADGSMAGVILLKKRIIGSYYVAVAIPHTKRKAMYVQSAYIEKDQEGADW